MKTNYLTRNRIIVIACEVILTALFTSFWNKISPLLTIPENTNNNMPYIILACSILLLISILLYWKTKDFINDYKNNKAITWYNYVAIRNAQNGLLKAPVLETDKHLFSEDELKRLREIGII